MKSNDSTDRLPVDSLSSRVRMRRGSVPCKWATPAALLLLALLLSITPRAFADDAVAFNRSNGKYHRLSCKWTRQCTANCEQIPLADAIARQGTPCKVCRPPSAASDPS